MKTQGFWRYLSNRILILAGLSGTLAAAFCLGGLAWAYITGFPLWPFAGMLAGLIVLAVAAYLSVVRPYRRIEQMMELFLDGYTIQSLQDPDISLTPYNQLVLDKVLEILRSDKLLNLNKRQAQYLALQNQINPHFLYNTLESIRGEALIGGLASVADMTEALANFFRYTISKLENFVSVEDELENSRTYFSIQQYRFGERLQLNILCDPAERAEIYRCRLPKLTLQPLLENSIIHGTECKVGNGTTTIRLQLTEKRLLIDVSDDGVGMDEAALVALNEKLENCDLIFSARPEQEERGGVGLVNVNNRIHLLFGEEYGLHVYSTQGVGTDVSITLPAISSDREAKGAAAYHES